MPATTPNKHTPGPWRVEAPKPARYPAHRILAATGYVAEVTIMAHNPASDDARLIAAAPELLAALELTLALHNMRNNVALQVPGYYVHLDPKAEAQIRAAIRKARGGSEVV